MIITTRLLSNISTTTINNTDNDTLEEVIGTKEDFASPGQDLGQVSVAGNLHTLHEHFHSTSNVYPRLANPVLLTKASGAWAALPTPKEIIPANTVVLTFDLHFALVDTISANGNYTIALYTGAAGAETLITTFAVSRSAVMSQEGSIPIITSLIPANTRISASLSSGNAAQDTLKIKLLYHTY